jgi:tetratricopeptide (TPR) repeat protein
MFLFVGAVAGFIMGAALGVFLMAKGMAPIWVAVLCPFVAAAAAASGTLWITNSAGSAASSLYKPSGRTTPPKKEYSQAEAMVIQGRYEDGITAFELAISEDAADPTPYLRIARVYRDNLARHEDAARWFRRALRESVIPRGIALLARKELVELYTHRLGQPERALPELARMAEELAGTDEGAWAARQLAEIKARMSSPEPTQEEGPATTP